MYEKQEAVRAACLAAEREWIIRWAVRRGKSATGQNLRLHPELLAMSSCDQCALCPVLYVAATGSQSRPHRDRRAINHRTAWELRSLLGEEQFGALIFLSRVASGGGRA